MTEKLIPPREVDSVEDIRNELIQQRNKALADADFKQCVLLSHAISWLAYARDAQAYFRDRPI